jgi:uncharacterized protein HemX
MHTRANSRAYGFRKGSTYLVMVVVTALALLVGGCAMNDTEKRTGGGAAIGALGGALLGGSREGALIGAAVGAAGGYMVDQHKKKNEAQSDNAQLRQENERLRLEAENQRLKEQTETRE